MAFKTVTITFKKEKLSVEPYEVTLYYNKTDGTDDDQAKWVCKDADCTVLFNKNGSPFITNIIPVPRGAAGTPSPKPTKMKARYRYTLSIKPAGAAEVSIDPEVVVDSGGPPGGGPRKAGKKPRRKKKP